VLLIEYQHIVSLCRRLLNLLNVRAEAERKATFSNWLSSSENRNSSTNISTNASTSAAITTAVTGLPQAPTTSTSTSVETSTSTSTESASDKSIENDDPIQPLKLIFPPPSLCTDNGVMAAWAGIEKLNRGISDEIEGQEVVPRWPLGAPIDGGNAVFKKRDLKGTYGVTNNNSNVSPTSL
jgi:hypothetical protein